jgi:hypothetical protein
VSQTNIATYRGQLRSGAPITGTASTDDLMAFVKQRYDRRWQALTVTRNGEEVGGISRHPDTGKRTWWAER